MDARLLIPILGMLIPILVIVLHYMTKWREQKATGVTAEKESAILERAQRLEDRIIQLESILDAESPGWRRRA